MKQYPINLIPSFWDTGGYRKGDRKLAALNGRTLIFPEKASFQQIKSIAREIVWGSVMEDYDEFDSLLSTLPVRHDVKDELKSLFMSLNLH